MQSLQPDFASLVTDPQLTLPPAPHPPIDKDVDVDVDGGFICAHCGATSVTQQASRGASRRKNDVLSKSGKKKKTRPPRPRTAIIDGVKVLLCNACGIHWQRKGEKRSLKPQKRSYARKKTKMAPTKEESPMYQVIKNRFSEQDAEFFWCDCINQCTARFLMEDKDDHMTLSEAYMDQLMGIHKRAHELKKSKGLAKDDKDKYRSFGKGHQSSKEYEEFVFANIRMCRERGLCGKFRKKLLAYSNDWLYKRPTIRNDDKTTSKGKPRVAHEKKFEVAEEDFPTYECCSKGCCRNIWVNQIKKWRKDYVEGNTDERWDVIQQMLIGEGMGSNKCVRCIRLITGCSRNLVTSVWNYLRQNQCMGRPPSQNKQKRDTSAPASMLHHLADNMYPRPPAPPQYHVLDSHHSNSIPGYHLSQGLPNYVTNALGGVHHLQLGSHHLNSHGHSYQGVPRK